MCIRDRRGPAFAASMNASNSATVSSPSSPWACRPARKGADGSSASAPSMTPSSDQAVATSPAPSLSMPWWWWQYTVGDGPSALPSSESGFTRMVRGS